MLEASLKFADDPLLEYYPGNQYTVAGRSGYIPHSLYGAYAAAKFILKFNLVPSRFLLHFGEVCLTINTVYEQYMTRRRMNLLTRRSSADETGMDVGPHGEDN